MRRRHRPFWSPARLPVAAIAAAFVAGGVVVAGAGVSSGDETIGETAVIDGVTVYISATDPPVYGLEPIDQEVAARITLLAEEDGASATSGDLADCHWADRVGQVDPACAVMLVAEQNGDLEVVDGDRTMLRNVPCGTSPGPGQIESCEGGFMSEAEVEDALAEGSEGK